MAGDQLVDARYQPIPIVEPSPGRLRGYSDILKIYICWENGELQWYDPVAETYLLDHEAQTERANAETARANAATARANAATARADAAEAEVQRLRSLLSQRTGPQ